MSEFTESEITQGYKYRISVLESELALSKGVEDTLRGERDAALNKIDRIKIENDKILATIGRRLWLIQTHRMNGRDGDAHKDIEGLRNLIRGRLGREIEPKTAREKFERSRSGNNEMLDALDGRCVTIRRLISGGEYDKAYNAVGRLCKFVESRLDK
jgi:hypothetical protein